MSKRQVIILLGILVIFLPFLGFISLWDEIISVIVGLLIVGIAYRMSPVDKSGTGNEGQTSSDGNSGQQDASLKRDLPYVDHQSESGPSTNI